MLHRKHHCRAEFRVWSFLLIPGYVWTYGCNRLLLNYLATFPSTATGMYLDTPNKTFQSFNFSVTKMELFVVNRHTGDDNDGTQKQITEEEEKNKLDKILKRIEKHKKIRNKQKEREKKIKIAKQKTLESRQIKRELKSKIIPVPDNSNDEFIDKNIAEAEEITDKKHKNSENLREIKKQKFYTNDLQGFTVLGDETFKKKNKVKRVLPKWLTNPAVISVNLQDLHVKVSDIKQLDKGIRKLLKANGIKYFFPVQSEVIPWLLETSKHADVLHPRDVCVSAPTGSGKTLAFVLPIIQALKKHSIRALVILPTQDLANQVFKTFKIYAQKTNIDVCLITGNNPFTTEQSQIITANKAFGLLSKIDILVCTAGRLVDHLKMTKGFSLQHLEFLVIDEADRVLENVQNDWLYHLEKHISQEESHPQTGNVLNLFSLQKRRSPRNYCFLQLYLRILKIVTDSQKEINLNPETFVGKYTTPQELSEKFIVTSLHIKPLVLYKLIKMNKLTKSVVFTHSVESAHRLSELKIEEISSSLSGKNRTTLIDKFSNKEIDLLVCTDALARGIDLPNVECVISYSAPKFLKTYIHRVGRTARAGELGLAVTLLQKTQLSKFKAMLQQGNKQNIEEMVISEEALESLGDRYKESLQKLKQLVEEEEKMDLDKNISAKRMRNLKTEEERT
ncbi:hypothetical protein NQ317_002523 [Molorchus minor]|uniref:ATP-dependent RNA helicase n=1 Tax=Molorchus minor TaxID=1323400 RepID=A0ABQ9IY95_9CUCU|nr:hypothetical protein NQ317_002523 [Molorchus minor]